MVDHQKPCQNQIKHTRQQSLDLSHSDVRSCESKNPANPIPHTDRSLYDLRQKNYDDDSRTPVLSSSPESIQLPEIKAPCASFEDKQYSNLRPSPDINTEHAIPPRTKGSRRYVSKGQSKKVKLISEPLSNFTKDPTSIPNIFIFVTRSTEERLKEIKEGKKPDKIKRPMNAFMLYRKAYQNTAKVLFAKNNHQVISQVCGQSWEIENVPIKAQFHDWAQIERDNHQKAFPEYKFSPSKPDPSKVSKRRSSANLNSDESDSENRPWRNTSPKRARKYDQDDFMFFSCDQSNSSFQSQESNSSFASHESDSSYLCHGHSSQQLSRERSFNPAIYHDTSKMTNHESKLADPFPNSVNFKLPSGKYFHHSTQNQYLIPRDQETAFCKMTMLDSTRYCHHNQSLQQNDILSPVSQIGLTRTQEQSVHSSLSSINQVSNGVPYLDFQFQQNMNYEHGQESFIKGTYWPLQYNSFEDGMASILENCELNSEAVERSNIYALENQGQFDEIADWTMS
ncbi:putative hmg box protein [Erysiphe neolycopersici]|uniref:Putative hmg box protein n=1 Tax=Erysiphe neolycopersici TaxID=212602 RepID=A0A420HV51_9PEZI|nr:putative hmg box protein [Erysiphe neolycopersici]